MRSNGRRADGLRGAAGRKNSRYWRDLQRALRRGVVDGGERVRCSGGDCIGCHSKTARCDKTKSHLSILVSLSSVGFLGSWLDLGFFEAAGTTRASVHTETGTGTTSVVGPFLAVLLLPS